MKLDLNCDLGEGEPARRTRALMRWVTSVNVACGGHAGDVETMVGCVRMAKEAGVNLGAHPGICDREGFGRGGVEMDGRGLQLLLFYQVGALERIAKEEGKRLSHVKLHGALYHAVEERRDLRDPFLTCMGRWWPRLRIYARAGGAVEREGRRRGLRVWGEVFADRAYLADGTLMPRGRAGAVLGKAAAVGARISRLLDRAEVVSESGRVLRVQARTLCLHSDTRGAVALARVARGMLG